jgi:hypothetical protein
MADKSVMSSFSEPAVIWRLRHPDGDTARATLIPGTPQSTLVFFVNEQLERGENFNEWESALALAEEVKRGMLTNGWRDDVG